MKCDTWRETAPQSVPTFRKPHPIFCEVDAMKWLSQDFENLHSLYINQLRVLLDAEEQIVRGLPVMITHVADEELRRVLQMHLEESNEHIKRLEQILAAEKSSDPTVDDTSPSKCKAIAAMKAEVEDMITDARDAWVRDAALIGIAQRIEHYEIASYGTVRQWALVLGENSAAAILDRTLKEEGNADHLLTAISARINVQARAA